MRLENVLALTYGTLVNEPFVKIFTNVVFEAKAVKRGDLFMAFDETSIEEAILNGAYGIIFSKPTQISDSEIAWIKVQSIEDALKRLLRFRLIDKNIKAYETNEIVLKLALQVITEQNFIAVLGDVRELSRELWDIDEGSSVLFCPALCDKEIFTNVIELSDRPYLHVNIIEQTLFETSFIYNDVFYERQLISPFFIPYLEILLHLFKNLEINYRLKKFMPIDHFEAVFTNKKFEIKEFGTSDKVLIFEKSCELIESEVLFLEREVTWAKTLYVLPSSHENMSNKVKNREDVVLYKSQNEILNILRENHFHFALIVGVDKGILAKPLVSQRQLTLFDIG